MCVWVCVRVIYECALEHRSGGRKRALAVLLYHSLYTWACIFLSRIKSWQVPAILLSPPSTEQILKAFLGTLGLLQELWGSSSSPHVEQKLLIAELSL